MNRILFYTNQFVSKDNMMDVQQKIADFAKKFNLEVVTIDGFIHEGFEARPTDPASLDFEITIGSGWKGYENLCNYATFTGTFDAPDATHPRIDLLAVKHATGEFDDELVAFKDPVTGALSSDTVKTSLKDYFELVYVAGTPAASPEAPELPADVLGSALVEIPAGATTIPIGNFTDIRVFKPDYLVSDHRTLNPLDHPNGCIFNVHIAPGANISLEKINGNGFASLSVMIQLATDMPALGTEEYNRNAQGQLESIYYPEQGVLETIHRTDGVMTHITTENDTFIYTQTFERDEAGALSKITKTLEAKP